MSVVLLLACAVGPASLEVWPPVFDFGQTGPGCGTVELPFSLENTGGHLLTVHEAELDLATWEIEVEVPVFPMQLQPGERVEGTAWYTPVAPGGPQGVFMVHSDDPAHPVVMRPLRGDSVGLSQVHIGFDDLQSGTRVLEQYADRGVHFVGQGAPGEGLDTNVVQRGSACTGAQLDSSPNVLCTWVNDGFNHQGEPGLAGWLDAPADAVGVRLYNAGVVVGGDRDTATLTAFDADGVVLGHQSATADTEAGQEFVDLVVEGPATSFHVHTGDFDAVDDVVIRRQPDCP